MRDPGRHCRRGVDGRRKQITGTAMVSIYMFPLVTLRQLVRDVNGRRQSYEEGKSERLHSNTNTIYIYQESITGETKQQPRESATTSTTLAASIIIILMKFL